MRSLSLISVVVALATRGILVASTPLKRSPDTFLAAEVPIALQGILNNIGDSGKSASGAHSGVVIASPSKSNPDYFYTWTRDSALTFKCLTDIFISNYSLSLQSQIQDYISAQAQLQTVTNPSGSLADGAGLAEPKFNVDLSAFTGPWGRPQRDGPALRATTLIAYSRWLISNGYSSTASSVVWPVIQNDLSYVAQYWNQTGFDLWEEVHGSSFFTTAVQHRALVEGNALARQLGFSCPVCVSQAPQILCFLQRFWDEAQNYVRSNININDGNGGRSAKDANSLLASIHTFDPAAGCSSTTFQPCSDRALANFKAVTDSFRSIYNINKGVPKGGAVAVGRYPEDVYQGGNPWYLTTLAAAELLYDAIYTWKNLGTITITSISLPFFLDLSPTLTITVGDHSQASDTFNTLISLATSLADSYVNLVAYHTPQEGALAEQFSRQDGYALSAVDLTWSYAALLTTARAKAGQVPASWGAGTIVESCPGPNSATGTYAPAPNRVFPPVGSQTPKSLRS